MKTVSIRKTVYPDGRVYNYKHGALQGKVKKLETEKYNRWMDYIQKLITTF